ncbi:MAG: hypothetical protein VB071_14410 [Lawsonibacter sp.]|nr:hypothetical protein [Lawsonibacter sp.]
MTTDDVITETTETAGTPETVETLEVTEDTSRPFLTTPFEDYTVTEGLLLIILLLAFFMFCIKVVKGGFSWL